MQKESVEKVNSRVVHTIKPAPQVNPRNPDGIGEARYVVKLDEPCPKCGYDRGEWVSWCGVGVERVTCRVCNYEIEFRG